MDNIMNNLQGWIVSYGMRILAAAVILFVGRYIANFLKSLIKKILEKGKVESTLVSFVSNVTYVAIMVFVVIAALGKLGVQTASFVAIIGAAGLAVGLALQGSLSNFASGVLIVIFKPFKIGDFIEGGGTSGVVEEIGIFTTEMKTGDNKKIIVPNSKLTGDNIVNYSVKPERRVDMVFGVSYKDDLDKVKHVIESVLMEDNRILKDPAWTIAVSELAESSVNLVVRPWVKNADYWGVFFTTQENLKKRFDAEGISIPFPQQDVHIHKEEV